MDNAGRGAGGQFGYFVHKTQGKGKVTDKAASSPSSLAFLRNSASMATLDAKATERSTVRATTGYFVEPNHPQAHLNKMDFVSEAPPRTRATARSAPPGVMEEKGDGPERPGPDDIRVVILNHLKMSRISEHDIITKSDPFVRITFSEAPRLPFETNTVPNADSAFWNLGYLVQPRDGDSGVFTFELLDRDFITNHDSITKFDVSVNDILGARHWSREHVVSGTSGGVNFELQCTSLLWSRFHKVSKDPLWIKLDFWTRAMVLAESYAKYKPTNGRTIPRSTSTGVATKPIGPMMPNSKCVVATTDEHYDGTTVIVGLRAMNLLPFDDKQTSFSDRAQGNRFIRELMDPPPPWEGVWTGESANVTSDAALTRICFLNQGSPYMHKTAEGFECRVDYLKDNTMRGCLPFAGTAFFTPDGVPTRISYLDQDFVPGQGKDWEWAKLAIRSAVFSCASLRHLMWGHFRWGNAPNTCLQLCLAPDHCVRRLLAPHTYRSALVALTSINSLMAKNSMFHRAIFMTWEGICQGFEDEWSSFRFEAFPEELAARGMDQLPEGLNGVTQDGTELHTIISGYVDSYLQLHYTDDGEVAADHALQRFWHKLDEQLGGLPALTLRSLKVVVAEIIFRVSGWHQHMGNVLGWLLDVGSVSMRLEREVLLNACESACVIGLIATAANTDMPKLLHDWSHLLPDDPTHQAVWQTLHTELAALSERIQERNQSRRFPFVDFDPALTKLSVSN